MLYSYNNQYPQELPFRIRLSDGRTRTDPTTFTSEEILDAGYIQTTNPPSISQYQRLSWSGTDWVVTTLTQQEIDEIAAQEKTNLIASFIAQTQSRLDEFARTRDYDNILSACSYAQDPNPQFAAEAAYCLQARSNTWTDLYAIIDEINQGTRPLPQSFAEIEPLLPVLQWPNP